ncbi:MAG: hypothetical protein WCT27_01730 [Patescibacteria group bacterium]
MAEIGNYRSVEEAEAAEQFNNEQKPAPAPVDVAVEKKDTYENSIDFDKCQMDKVVDAYLKGVQLEWESYSPYLSDHKLSTGELLKDNLPQVEKIGVAIGKYLREKFDKARMISLYDEYNTDMPDTMDAYGQPVDIKRTHRGTDGELTLEMPGKESADSRRQKMIQKSGEVAGEFRQISLSDEVKAAFRNNIKEFLVEQGVIKPQDKEEDSYLLVSESSKTETAPELIKALYEHNHELVKGPGVSEIITGGQTQDKTITFKDEFTLRSKEGRWMCEALDASAFLDPENRKITHLVILPEHFKSQQDRVWTMLNSMGFQAENYHNIYFGGKSDPDWVVNKIAEKIEQAFAQAS